MKKRVLSLILAVAVFAALAVPASAASDFSIQGSVLMAYTGSGGDVVIPNGITEIGHCAFSCNDTVTSVVIPDGVTKIGEAAFEFCGNLTSVTIPDSVQEIGPTAFIRCNSLRSVTIPSSVTTIGAGAFSSCFMLFEIQIPASVTSIGANAFNGYPDLIIYGIPGSAAETYAKENRIRFMDSSNDFIIDGGTLVKYLGTGEDVTIPSGVTKIGNQAFRYCTDLTSVTIPDGVTSIGDWAFSNTNLTSASIPASVTSIDISSFPSQITIYGEPGSYAQTFAKEHKHTFVSTSGTSVPDNTPPVSDNAGFVIDNGVLVDYTGSGGSVTIPSTVTEIGAKAFYNCESITSVVIPDSVTSIGTSAFGNCNNLTSVTIPDSVTTMGNNAFYFAGLTSVTIPSGLTEIGENVFSSCRSLTSVTFAHGASTMGKRMFSGCFALAQITIPNSMKELGEEAFSHCTALESVTIPSSVSKVEEAAFSSCTGLKTVVLEDGVAGIGQDAFFGCTALESVTIPSSVVEIHSWAFRLRLGDEHPDNLVIYGEAGSYAQRYTQLYDIPFVASLQPAAPAVPESGIASASSNTITVDGVIVLFDAYALTDANGGVTNYLKLRDIAYVLSKTAARFNVGWDDASQTISITTGVPYTDTNGTEMSSPFSGDQPYAKNAARVLVDGKEVSMEAITLTDSNGGQYTYFKLRDLGAALGFTVDWSEERDTYIETA